LCGYADVQLLLKGNGNVCRTLLEHRRGARLPFQGRDPVGGGGGGGGGGGRGRGRGGTRRHNYKVTSAPPSRLSLNKQKCLQ